MTKGEAGTSDARADGTKGLVAMTNGYRVSSPSARHTDDSAGCLKSSS